MLFYVALNFVLAAAPVLTQSTLPTSAQVPDIPSSVTRFTQISSALATATLALGLGNPADITNYPLCAQICSNETIGVREQIGLTLEAPNILNGLCGVQFRSLSAGCEAITCGAEDLQKVRLLARQLCGNLYKNNATLSSSVSVAVASATAGAIAATEGKDVTDISDYPKCAKTCFSPNNFNGCGGLANRECVCQSTAFNNAVIPCEKTTCSGPDLTNLLYLSLKLCQPVGGVLTHPTNSTPASNTTTGSSTPSPSPFTGGSSQLSTGLAATIIGLAAVALGLLML